MRKHRSVTDEDLVAALGIAARIIDRYGDVYWPIFERLEKEREARRSRGNRLGAYLSNGSTSQPVPQKRDANATAKTAPQCTERGPLTRTRSNNPSGKG